MLNIERNRKTPNTTKLLEEIERLRNKLNASTKNSPELEEKVKELQSKLNIATNKNRSELRELARGLSGFTNKINNPNANLGVLKSEITLAKEKKRVLALNGLTENLKKRVNGATTVEQVQRVEKNIGNTNAEAANQAQINAEAANQAQINAEANRKAKEEANREAKEKANREAKEEANRKKAQQINEAKETLRVKAKSGGVNFSKNIDSIKNILIVNAVSKKINNAIEKKSKKAVSNKAKEEANREAREEANREAKEKANREAKEEANRKKAQQINEAKETLRAKANSGGVNFSKNIDSIKNILIVNAVSKKINNAIEKKSKKAVSNKAKEEANREAREEANREAKEKANREAKEEANRKKAQQINEAKETLRAKANSGGVNFSKNIDSIKNILIVNAVSKKINNAIEKKSKKAVSNKAKEEANREAKEKANREAKEEANRKKAQQINEAKETLRVKAKSGGVNFSKNIDSIKNILIVNAVSKKINNAIEKKSKKAVSNLVGGAIRGVVAQGEANLKTQQEAKKAQEAQEAANAKKAQLSEFLNAKGNAINNTMKVKYLKMLNQNINVDTIQTQVKTNINKRSKAATKIQAFLRGKKAQQINKAKETLRAKAKSGGVNFSKNIDSIKNILIVNAVSKKINNAIEKKSKKAVSNLVGGAIRGVVAQGEANSKKAQEEAKKAKEAVNAKKTENATLKVQAAFRGKQGRERAEKMKEAKKAQQINKAKETLRAKAKSGGVNFSKNIDSIKNILIVNAVSKKINNAIEKKSKKAVSNLVGGAIRGVVAQGEANRKKAQGEANRKKAATKIQAMYRGKKAQEAAKKITSNAIKRIELRNMAEQGGVLNTFGSRINNNKNLDVLEKQIKNAIETKKNAPKGNVNESLNNNNFEAAGARERQAQAEIRAAKDREISAAATKIQAMYRGGRNRKKVEKLKAVKAQKEASAAAKQRRQNILKAKQEAVKAQKEASAAAKQRMQNNLKVKREAVKAQKEASAAAKQKRLKAKQEAVKAQKEAVKNGYGKTRLNTIKTKLKNNASGVGLENLYNTINKLKNTNLKEMIVIRKKIKNALEAQEQANQKNQGKSKFKRLASHVVTDRQMKSEKKHMEQLRNVTGPLKQVKQMEQNIKAAESSAKAVSIARKAYSNRMRGVAQEIPVSGLFKSGQTKTQGEQKSQTRLKTNAEAKLYTNLIKKLRETQPHGGKGYVSNKRLTEFRTNAKKLLKTRKFTNRQRLEFTSLINRSGSVQKLIEQLAYIDTRTPLGELVKK
jgi:hypothetical protein